MCLLRFIFENEYALFELMEYCGRQNLQEFLRPLPDYRLHPRHGKKLFMELAKGLKYMHDVVGYCHRDIKMMNVVVHPYIDEEGNQSLQSNWIDFGFCWPIQKKSPYFPGTASYKSPEVVKKEKPYYCAPSDVWSLGVLMFKVIIGEYPFGGKNLNLAPFNWSLGSSDADLKDNIVYNDMMFPEELDGQLDFVFLDLVDKML
jgi:serine/threonine protein kinase